MNANELADELERLHQQHLIDGVADLAMPEAATMLRQLQAENEALKAHPVKELTDEVKDALMDALSGWKYIRQCHGDLYGVGWDRVQDKLEAILRKASEK